MRPQQRHCGLAARLSELFGRSDYRMNKENQGFRGRRGERRVGRGQWGRRLGERGPAADEQVRRKGNLVDQEFGGQLTFIFQISRRNAFRGRDIGAELAVDKTDEVPQTKPEVGKKQGEQGTEQDDSHHFETKLSQMGYLPELVIPEVRYRYMAEEERYGEHWRGDEIGRHSLTEQTTEYTFFANIGVSQHQTHPLATE